MTTEEHLDLIVKRCKELLVIAEKRTPGEWEPSRRIIGKKMNDSILAESGHLICEGLTWNDDYEGNAQFIASCAGSAEAGWKATIAAIEDIKGRETEYGVTARHILDAWPIETLRP